MIKESPVPAGVGRLMANLADRREPRGRVLGLLGPLVVGPVAAEAIPSRSPKDVVLVAGGAGLAGVGPDERIARVVVEPPLGEGGVGRIVADLAEGRKAGRGVRRIPSPGVILTVTGKAIRGRTDESPALMAARTSERGVAAVQGEAGSRAVVPLSPRPRERLVAFFALGSQPGPVRIVLTPDPVAAVTVLGRPLDHSVSVARGAGNGDVPAFEPVFGLLVEGHRGAGPRGCCVAGGAGFLQCPLMRVLVAGRTGLGVGPESSRRPRPLEPRGLGGVAGRAIHGRVAARQGIFGFGVIRSPVASGAFRSGRLVADHKPGPAGFSGRRAGVAFIAGCRLVKDLEGKGALFVREAGGRLEPDGIVTRGAVWSELAGVLVPMAGSAGVRERTITDGRGRHAAGRRRLLRVAFAAIQGRVGSFQPVGGVLLMIECGISAAETRRRVAGFAGLIELTKMDVFVAIEAGGPERAVPDEVRPLFRFMALGAGHRGVLSGQRVP